MNMIAFLATLWGQEHNFMYSKPYLGHLHHRVISLYYIKLFILFTPLLMIKQIMMTMSVQNIEKSKEFFGKLGFSFDPQLTGDTAAHVIINPGQFSVMLMQTSVFKSFTTKEVVDAHKAMETSTIIVVNNKEDVGTMLEKAVAAGAIAGKIDDEYEWMYSQDFQDLDGHSWQITWMEMNATPTENLAA